MMTPSLCDPVVVIDQHPAPHLASRSGRERTIHRIQPDDVAAIKVLFRKLHAFNAALDPQFALSEEWETHFDAAMRQALGGAEILCLIAQDTDTGQPYGVALAAIHHDSNMWR
jgi:hypothetical protein